MNGFWKIVLIINKRSGTSASRLKRDYAQLISEFAKYSDSYVTLERIYVRGGEIHDAIKDLLSSKPSIIVAVGGDGTVSAVAAHLAHTNIPMAVIPMGTYNNFAKDNHIPMNIEAAVRNIFKGKIKRIDVASINGRIFVNNSSIGLYPHAVMLTRRKQLRLGYSKLYASILSILNILRIFPVYKLKIRTHSHVRKIITPFLFVGNNIYHFNIYKIIKRESLTNGMLSLYYSNCTKKRSIIKQALLALINRLPKARDFVAENCTELHVIMNRKFVQVSIDGEITKMKLPLVYKIHNLALKLITPIEL